MAKTFSPGCVGDQGPAIVGGPVPPEISSMGSDWECYTLGTGWADSPALVHKFLHWGFSRCFFGRNIAAGKSLQGKKVNKKEDQVERASLKVGKAQSGGRHTPSNSHSLICSSYSGLSFCHLQLKRPALKGSTWRADEHNFPWLPFPSHIIFLDIVQIPGYYMKLRDVGV